MRTAEDVEKIIRIANNKFPIELEDDFEKNLRKIEYGDKIYWLRKINDIVHYVKDHYWVSISGKVWSEYSRRFLARMYSVDGYLRTEIYDVQGRKRTFGVHRLLLLVFNYNDDYENLQVNHKDGDKKNNKISNLEWTTQLENFRHALDNNLVNGNYVTKKEEREIIKYLKDIYNNNRRDVDTRWLSNKYDVSKNTIRFIRRKAINRDELPSDIGDKMYRLANGKYTYEQIHDACKLLEMGELICHTYRTVGINKGTFNGVLEGESYQDISVQYDIHRDPVHKFHSLNLYNIKRINDELDKNKLSYTKIASKFDICYKTLTKVREWLLENNIDKILIYENIYKKYLK
jgi:hypothetical protein